MAGYIVVKKSYSYDDSYYNFEEGVEVTPILYKSKEEVIEALDNHILGLFKSWNGTTDSSNFNFKMFDAYDDGCERLRKFFDKKGFPYDKDDYEMTLPSGLDNQTIIDAYKNSDIELFEIIKLEE